MPKKMTDRAALAEARKRWGKNAHIERKPKTYRCRRTGEKKERHVIDRDLCSKCGQCYESCKFEAIAR